jgi:methylphosphotriester-DNA--protein-cysteine methyltransferase
MGQLLREVRISPFHFIRQFQAVFGATPRQFRITSRIELAKQLIAHGEHSVTDVLSRSASRAWAASARCSRSASQKHQRPTAVASEC